MGCVLLFIKLERKDFEFFIPKKAKIPHSISGQNQRFLFSHAFPSVVRHRQPKTGTSYFQYHRVSSYTSQARNLEGRVGIKENEQSVQVQVNNDWDNFFSRSILFVGCSRSPSRRSTQNWCWAVDRPDTGRSLGSF